MDNIIVLNSKLIEEKIQIIYQTEKILDSLYYKLFQIQKECHWVSAKELNDVIHLVKNMLQITEKLHFILERFLYEMDTIMIYTRDKLDELQEFIVEVFV